MAHSAQQSTKNSDASKHKNRKGALIPRRFTTGSADLSSQITWAKRDVEILDDKGRVVFEQKDVEVPDSWSQMAATIVASKYFSGELGTKTREGSVRAVVERVVSSIAKWGREQGYFGSGESAGIFADELSAVLLTQRAAFNSPVWFNVGVQEKPQCSACFIIGVEDTMDSLLELQTLEGKLFKFGSGTGTNLSTIRSSKEKLQGGGKPSGPVSFMRAYDGWASVIKSGGKTRRAAKMQILNVDHPDIIEFIRAKSNEEKKAWALIEEGYDPSFAAVGGAYDSVSFQNCNTSVRVSDEFMRAAERGAHYWTKSVTDGQRCEELDAKSVLMEIAQAAHICGDPGLQFDDSINDWHTCQASGRINASNPCSEYMHLDNSACNLSSINLLKFLAPSGEFLVDDFRHTAALLITAQDILVDASTYPTEKIARCAHEFRQLGLGYSNLGALLMNLGLPYDSEAGREWAAHITALMTGAAYAASARLAGLKGSFKGFEKNRASMRTVIDKHRSAAESLGAEHVPESLALASRYAWREASELGADSGFRNSQTTVLAPTGTISFMMDCDTTGIEPELSLIKYKKLVGGGYLKMVNGSVVSALRRLGYSDDERNAIVEYIDRESTIEGAPHVKPEHLAVFDCALRPASGGRMINYQGHLKMMAAAQPFLSGAISKTVNLPEETSVQDIYNVYFSAWRLGLKALALYRDGSKRTQPLTNRIEKAKEALALMPARRRLPDEREAITHKFSVAGLEGYVTVGLFEDGSPGEIFVVVAKEGSTLSGVMDAFATSISMALQYGVPLKDLVRKFSHLRFEPAGFTGNKEIPSAKSIIDYIFRWLGIKFLKPEEREALGITSAGEAGFASKPSAGKASGGGEDRISYEDAPPCLSCGSGLMVRSGACYVCLNCGAQGGCG